MKRKFSTHNLGCANCGGVMSFFSTHCPYCREEVPWSARMNVLGDLGPMILIVAGVAGGMLLGWIGYHIPKPNVVTGLSPVVLLWYAQQVAWWGHGSTVSSAGNSIA